MKTKEMKSKSIRKWTEPLVYIVLVASFGFITTIVNHTRDVQPVFDTELVSQNLENEFEALFL